MFWRRRRARADVWLCSQCGRTEVIDAPAVPKRCPSCRNWQAIAPQVDVAKGEYETRGDAA